MRVKRYSASKAALWSFAQGFAAELLPRGIRVNAVSPGFIRTPSMGIDAPEEWKTEFSRIGDETTPMRRHGTAEEVAAATLFLAFEATFSTAVKLPVDGGLGRRIQAPASGVARRASAKARRGARACAPPRARPQTGQRRGAGMTVRS